MLPLIKSQTLQRCFSSWITTTFDSSGSDWSTKTKSPPTAQPSSLRSGEIPPHPADRCILPRGMMRGGQQRSNGLRQPFRQPRERSAAVSKLYLCCHRRWTSSRSHTGSRAICTRNVELSRAEGPSLVSHPLREAKASSVVLLVFVVCSLAVNHSHRISHRARWCHMESNLAIRSLAMRSLSLPNPSGLDLGLGGYETQG